MVTFECVRASLSLSGENPAVKLIRGSGPPEVFEGVTRIMRMSSLERRELSKEKDFIGSILERRAADFGPSVVELRTRAGTKRVDGVTGIEIIRGGVEDLYAMEPKP